MKIIFEVKNGFTPLLSCSAFEEEKAAAQLCLDAEKDRLLYVAATRARRALIVANDIKANGESKENNAWKFFVDRAEGDFFSLLPKGEIPVTADKSTVSAEELYKNFAKMLKGFPKSTGSNLTHKIGNPPKLTSKPVFCMWSDLLGFSNHFTESNWNLSKKQKQQIYDRLVAAHSSVLYYSRPDERNLILNDGIAKIYSISEYEKNSLGALGLFLRFCIELHMTISNTEKHDGYPGCRSVIAFGEYIEYLADEVRFDDYVFNYSKPQESDISEVARKKREPFSDLQS